MPVSRAPTGGAADDEVGAIIVAAGSSTRMDGVDKVLVPLMGLPLVAHSLRVFNSSPLVGSIVLVMSAANLDAGRRLVEEHGWAKVMDVCRGGRRRQDSVRVGLERLADPGWTIVHDAARPGVDEGFLERGLSAARETGAAVAAVPVRDTIKSAGPDGTVTRTLPRDGLWVVQTPQVFKTDLLLRAHRRVTEDVTDDASMVELVGGSVRLFMGSFGNIKVTAPEDLSIAHAVVSRKGEKGGNKTP